MKPFDIHFGQYQASRQKCGYAVDAVISGAPEEDFWLPVVNSNNGIVGHIHFTSLGSGFFAIDQLRPGFCPMQDPQAVCTRSLCLRKEGM
jgi:hypothetical protein